MIDLIELALRPRIQLITEPIAWGTPYTPTKGVPYVTYELVYSSTPMAIGVNTPELWRGSANLTYVHPAEDGPVPARARAVQIRDLFPIGLTLVQGICRLLIESRDIQPAYLTTDWINVPVIVRWYVEEPHV